MDTLTSLLQKINFITKTKPIFYACNNAERALGLEDLIENYHIINIDCNQAISYIRNSGINIFCLEESLNQKNPIKRNSNKLINHQNTLDYINQNRNEDAYLMVFKIAPNIEKTAEKLNLKLLNTTSSLNRKFELKISQFNELSKVGINFPKTEINNLKNFSWEEIEKIYGSKIIIQFDRGHTGSGTLIIQSKTELEELKNKYPERTVRLAKYIEGKAYTLNACITKKGIFMGGLNYQLTGLPEATSNPNATVGNDWYYPRLLNKEIINKIKNNTMIIGETMRTNGFLGMFGIDLIVKDNEVYIIEVNARQPASIPMYTYLQIERGQIPLKLIHIAEFMGVDYEIDIEEYNKINLEPIEASQIFIRSIKKEKSLLTGKFKVG